MLTDDNNQKRKSLGRGLGSLLGEDMDDFDLDLGLSNSNNIAVNLIVPSPYQPRKEFDADALNSLVASIKDKGVLQPLLVRKVDDKYELIAGERRWRASKIAGLVEVPVIIKDLNDKETLEVALVENLLRENLSAIEEAQGFQRLIDEFSHTQEVLSQIIGKSRSHIANMLRLLSLPSPVQNLINEGKLSAGHGRSLVGLENAEDLAHKIVSKELSVRQTEELVAKQKEARVENKEKVTASKDNDVADIEKDLIKSLGLRLKIIPSKQGGGKVVLQYASVAELDMIIEILERKNQASAQNTVFKPAVATEVAQTSEKFTIKMID